MKKISFVLMLALFMVPGPLFAGTVLSEVKGLQVVKSLFPPQVKVTEARDLGSIYELVVQEPKSGKQLFYATKDGEYLIAGNLINKDRVNLTQERREEIDRVDMSKLPLQDAIKIKKGNGAKELIMFADVDCPFCRRAYSWLQTKTNYTLYMFFFPLSIHPGSYDKTVRILCAEDRLGAIERAMSGQEISNKKCGAGEKILTRQKAVADKVGIDGTPLFITDTGARITGLQIPALENYLKN